MKLLSQNFCGAAGENSERALLELLMSGPRLEEIVFHMRVRRVTAMLTHYIHVTLLRMT
jgi:hypothetical protein